jgi:hypothetical protein
MSYLPFPDGPGNGIEMFAEPAKPLDFLDMQGAVRDA